MKINDVAGIIITFHPTNDMVKNIKKLENKVGEIIIIDNTPNKSKVLKNFCGNKNINIFYNEKNIGIAAALNMGMELAIKKNYLGVILFDQDSEVIGDLVAEILNVYNGYLNNDEIAIIGSNYIDVANRFVFMQNISRDKYFATKEVITSGSFIPVKIYKEIGCFREEYFIDMVDLEWCFRARKKGYKILLLKEILMHHSVGNGTCMKIFNKKISLSNHSPKRRYYIFRNSLSLLNEVGFFDVKWCMNIGFNYLPKTFIKACFLEKNKMQNLKWIFMGFLDWVIKKYDRKVL